MGEVRHVPERLRFVLEEDGHTGFMTYLRKDGTIVFTHTIVPPELEGTGIGSQIVRAGLDFARGEGLKVVPQCSFVAGYVERHPEYSDLLA